MIRSYRFPNPTRAITFRDTLDVMPEVKSTIRDACYVTFEMADDNIFGAGDALGVGDALSRINRVAQALGVLEKGEK